MTHTLQLQDPLYKNWVKGGIASKYLKEGIEHVINNLLIDIQRLFLSDICNHLTIREAKCTDCTTANCLLCPTKGICNITGKGRVRKCSYHVKGDTLKEYKKCPKGICNNFLTKIINQHRYGRPAWQNTDARKWCTDHWEIAKCFLPGSGYADKTSVEDTDCSGILNLAITCLDIQKHLDLNLEPPKGVFSKILKFRNKIFHSAALSLTTETLEKNIDLMISVLRNSKELGQDDKAQIAALKLEKLKDKQFSISTEDESEIRQKIIFQFKQDVTDNYLGRKRELQKALCRMYEEHFNTIPISPLLDDIEAEIDDVFVELVLCNDTMYNEVNSEEISRQNGQRITNYKDIFYNDQNKCKNIYIIGDAGMGKSTWCMKLLRNWVSAQTKIKTIQTQTTVHQTKPDRSTQLEGATEQQSLKLVKYKLCEDIIYMRKRTPTNFSTDLENIPIQKKRKKEHVKQEQSSELYNLNADEKVMTEFDIVLFVSLRHASDDVTLRSMIKNQLFQENPHLDDLTNDVLKYDSQRCLIIVDGLDEWSSPVHFKSSSLLQHPSLPGRKGLNDCTILTTTRPWKLNSIRLQKKDIDKNIKMQGIEDTKLLARKVINCKNKMSEPNVTIHDRSFEIFKMDLESAFKKTSHFYFNWDYEIPFLRVPLILIFIVCTWFDNGRLENTLAGNFNGFVECLLIAAEKDENSRRKGRLFDMDGFENLKLEWSQSTQFLPKSLQKFEKCSLYSKLLLKLGKLAFDFLFDRKHVRLVFTESQLRSKLTAKELEVAVKIGILSQSKIIGKTLACMSSLSFLHKTLQEYLAAVYLCSAADGHNEAVLTYVKVKQNMERNETINVRKFVIDLNLSTVNELLKHFAKLDLLGKLWCRDIIEKWQNMIATTTSNFYVYGAVLSGTDYQTLEIKPSAMAYMQLPEQDNGKDDIIAIDRKLTWLPEMPSKPINQLQTVTLLRLNAPKSNVTQKPKIDLSHCKYLESLWLEDMSSYKILINYSKLTDITLMDLKGCDIDIIKTNISYDSQFKELKTINMEMAQYSQLSLPSVVWKIHAIRIFGCKECVIKIDKVDTSSAPCHVIHSVDCSNSRLDDVRMETENELKIETLILSNGCCDDINKSFVAYNPSRLSFPDDQADVNGLDSEMLQFIAHHTSLKYLDIGIHNFKYFEVAECLPKMIILEKLYIKLNNKPDEIRQLMLSIQTLPNLKDLGFIIGGYDTSSHLLAECL